MEIEKSAADGITTLKLSGEIDLHASPALRAELQNCVRTKTATLLLDFGSVDYIDSSGLATLIEYVRESAAFKGKVALFGLQKKVRTIFDLVRLNELFVISGTAEEAAAALAAKK
jgi:anti-sigma B factor antagonist